MSLRTRLFLFFGGLVSLLVGAEWALVTALTDDLEQEVGDVAFQVGEDVLGFFLPRVVTDGEAPAPATPPALAPRLRRDPDGPRVPRSAERQRTFVFGDADLRGSEGWLTEPGAVAVQMPRVHLHGTPSGKSDVIVHRQRAITVQHELRTEGPPRPGAGRQERHQVLRIVYAPNGLFVPEEGADLGLLVDVSGDFEIETRDLGETVAGLVRLELADAGSNVFFDDDVHRDVEWSFEGELEPAVEDVRLARRSGPPPRAGGQAVVAPADGPALVVEAEEAPADAAADADEPLAHEIPIPRDGVDTAVEGFLRRLWLGSIAIFGLGLLVAGYVAHRVTVPLRQLSRAAREVGEGALGTQVLPRGDREVAETLAAFNQMSARLADLDAEARALREREHLSEMGEVARGLAHAMRNPLHLLGLAVDQLAVRGGDGTAPLAGSARGQIQRIDRSLRSFLSLSAGGGAVDSVDVVDLARDVALELLQDEGGASVRVEADGTCRLAAVGPELRAVLHVLVVNAVEASPPGAEVTVRVACEEGGQVRFEVADRGPGLPEAVRGRLFTPHLTTKEQGAGMGLYLAHKIASTGYGGSLQLADREGGGTLATLVVRDRRGADRG